MLCDYPYFLLLINIRLTITGIYNVSSYVGTYTAVDFSGNKAVCNFTITVTHVNSNFCIYKWCIHLQHVISLTQGNLSSSG